MVSIRKCASIVAVIACLYAIATVASVVATLLHTRLVEAIGIGVLVPLFVLPAIAVYVFLTAAHFSARIRHASYWLLFLPVPLMMLPVMLFPSEGARSDGADQMALIFMIPTLSAGGMAFLAEYFWRPTKRCS